MLDGLAVATQVRGSTSRATAARWAADFVAVEVGVDVETLRTPSGRSATSARRRPAARPT
jgi:hypothetical protein